MDASMKAAAQATASGWRLSIERLPPAPRRLLLELATNPLPVNRIMVLKMLLKCPAATKGRQAGDLEP